MLEFVTLALAVLWVIVLLQGAALIELLRQFGKFQAATERQGAMILANEGLPTGTAVPDISTILTLTGNPIGKAGLADYLILFLSPDCKLCREIAYGIPDLDLDVSVPVLSAVHADVTRVETFARDFRLAPQRILADVDGKVAADFNVVTTPSVVVVHGGLSQRYGVVNSVDQVIALYDLARSETEVPI